MCPQPLCAYIIIEQEKQKGVRDGLPSILEHPAVKSSYAPFLLVYLFESIKNASVFAFVGSRRGLSQLSLHLEARYNQVERIDGEVRDRGSC